MREQTHLRTRNYSVSEGVSFLYPKDARLEHFQGIVVSESGRDNLCRKGGMIVWRRYNPNPSKLKTIDCTVRAICAVTGWDWFRSYDVLCQRGREMLDMPSSDRVWWSVLRDLGFTRVILPNKCPDCYTVSDFAADHKTGIYVAGPPNHAVAIIDGDWWDTWDSGMTVPTYIFEGA